MCLQYLEIFGNNLGFMVACKNREVPKTSIDVQCWYVIDMYLRRSKGCKLSYLDMQWDSKP